MKRLDALYDAVTPAETIADVGCDHGIIAGRCYTENKAKKVIASDKSKKCLEKAEKNLKNCAIEFVCCDGICYNCDEAVIAGIGGTVICNILLKAKADGFLPATLVLMPHSDCYKVRLTLIRLGYGIEKDFMIKDKKFYTVIRAEKKGTVQNLNETQLLFGAFADKIKDEVLIEYLRLKRAAYSVAKERNAEKIKKILCAEKIQNELAR